jgi:hypothetical protein
MLAAVFSFASAPVNASLESAIKSQSVMKAKMTWITSPSGTRGPEGRA